MQQFVVPQFIDVEDKIFGPITIRQFLIFMVAGLVIFLAFRFGKFWVFVTTLILLGGTSLIFAFYRPNGQAFHYFLLNIFQTLRKPSLRLWRKDYGNDELNYLRGLVTEKVVEEGPKKKPVREQHIRDLALVVNTGGYYRPDDGF